MSKMTAIKNIQLAAVFTASFISGIIAYSATLVENAAAITNAAAQIDAAIVAKGGATAGGLNNAAAAIAALPSGGGIPTSVVQGILGHTLSGDVTIALSGGSVAEYGFYRQLNSFTIAISGITTLQSNAFRDSTGLTAATFPNATTVVMYPFFGCSNLRTITVPNLNIMGTMCRMAPSVLTDVYITNKTAAQIMDMSGFPGYSGTAQQPNEDHLTFYGSDAKVQRVDGVWTIVSY